MNTEEPTILNFQKSVASNLSLVMILLEKSRRPRHILLDKYVPLFVSNESQSGFLLDMKDVKLNQ